VLSEQKHACSIFISGSFTLYLVSGGSGRDGRVQYLKVERGMVDDVERR
jgi:hypothetical protein